MYSIWDFEKERKVEEDRKKNLRLIGTQVDSFFMDKAPELGFEERTGQWEMSCEIVQAMIDKKHILVEAGVGIGKTYAYIVPLLYYHMKYKKPVIIATSTIALQEQLASDLEAIANIFNYHPEILLAKGQNHFLCKNRLEQYFIGKRNTDEYKYYKTINSGGHEKADWNIEIPEKIWNMINVSSFNPTICRQTCPHKDYCFYYQLRSNMKNSKGFILCNQDLLTMNLRKRNDYANEMIASDFQYIVIDEAHNLESKVRNSYTIQFTFSECKSAVENLKKIDRRLGGILNKKIIICFSMLDQVFSILLRQVKSQDIKAIKKDRDIERYYVNRNIKGLDKFVELLDDLYDSVSMGFGIENTYKTRGEDEALEKVGELYNFFSSLLKEDKDIFWMNTSTKNKYGITISKCPKNVNELTENLLFNNENFRVIMTSATISNDGFNNYNYFILNTNLPVDRTMICDSKESPFDYNNHAMIYFTENIPHPSNEREAFIIAGVDEIVRILNLTNGKSLILFTAKRDMLQVYDILKEKVPYNILMQNNRTSQNDIISQFKVDENSVLLGTGSYWEGISIDGRALSNLIIFRLPFPVPEPIIDYKRSISNDGLMDVSVPEMIIKLKQGIGRLIRNETDYGIVSIIDPRLGQNSHVPYKQMVWDALPIKNKTNNFEKLREFYFDLEKKYTC